MRPRPSFDRALLIPIAIGVISLLGIGWILLTSDLGRFVLSTTWTPTNSGSLEPDAPTPPPAALPTRDETPTTATETEHASYPAPPTETLPSPSTLVTESVPTLSATPTPDQIKPFKVGTYDDTDPNIAYDRYWTALKNLGTANSYKGTIHVSSSIGDQASFRFTGERFRLGYQRGKNFGIVTVRIDGQPYSFNEQAFDFFWRSPLLSPGDHFVQIIHESGESINLDYIEIIR